jgi:hypothetical protein
MQPGYAARVDASRWCMIRRIAPPSRLFFGRHHGS